MLLKSDTWTVVCACRRPHIRTECTTYIPLLSSLQVLLWEATNQGGTDAAAAVELTIQFNSYSNRLFFFCQCHCLMMATNQQRYIKCEWGVIRKSTDFQVSSSRIVILDPHSGITISLFSLPPFSLPVPRASDVDRPDWCIRHLTCNPRIVIQIGYW